MCWHHGGAKKSTPRPEAMGQLLTWRAARIAAGLPASAGRSYPGPRGKQARFLWMAEKVIATIPAGPLDKPLEAWSHGELLSDAARSSLLGLRAFVTKRAITAETDFKEDRQLADVMLGVAKLYAHVQVSQLRHVAEQEDWAAYQAELEREARTLGAAPETRATLRMREKRAAKKAAHEPATE